MGYKINIKRVLNPGEGITIIINVRWEMIGGRESGGICGRGGESRSKSGRNDESVSDGYCKYESKIGAKKERETPFTLNRGYQGKKMRNR